MGLLDFLFKRRQDEEDEKNKNRVYRQEDFDPKEKKDKSYLQEGLDRVIGNVKKDPENLLLPLLRPVVRGTVNTARNFVDETKQGFKEREEREKQYREEIKKKGFTKATDEYLASETKRKGSLLDPETQKEVVMGGLVNTPTEVAGNMTREMAEQILKVGKNATADDIAKAAKSAFKSKGNTVPASIIDQAKTFLLNQTDDAARVATQVVDDVPLVKNAAQELPDELKNVKPMDSVGDILQNRDIPLVQSSDNMAAALPTQPGQIGATLDDAPSAPPGMKERKFITSVKEKPGAVDEIKERAEGFYKPIINKQTIATARQMIDDNYDDAVLYARERGTADPVQNAVRMELIDKLQKEGRIDEALDILENFTASEATTQGQAIQVLSAWGKLTPAGALRFAKRQISKVVKPKQNDVARRATKTITKVVKDVNDEVLDDVVDDVTRKAEEVVGKAGGIPTGGDIPLVNATKKKVKEALTPEQKLAQKINVPSNKPKEVDPIEDMVNTLYQQAKNTLPKNKQLPRDPLELVKEAIENRKEYGRVWEAAKEIVQEKYGDKPEALEMLNDYFQQVLDKPFSQNQLNKVVSKGIKEQAIDIGQIVREHYSQVNKAGQTLKDTLVEKAGLTDESAQILADSVAQRFNELTRQKKESILKQMFTERQLKQKDFLDRVIELSNLGAFDESKYFDDVAKKLKIPHLSQEVADQITNLANEIQTLPQGSREQQVKVGQMMNLIAEQTPTNMGEFLSGIQTIGQLLNPKTAIRNVIGNTGFMATENVKDVVAAPIDAAVGLVTGKRTKFMPDLKTQAKGLSKGFKEGFEDALNNVNTAPGSTQFELPKASIFKGNSKFAKFGKGLEKVLNVELRAPDRAFFQAAYDESLRQQMKANKINDVAEITQEMMDEAVLDGLYRTFQDDNIASNLFSRLKKGLNTIGINDGAFGLGDLVIKYPKTPGSLLSRAVEYSPAGFFGTVTEMAKPFVKGEAFNQKAFVDKTARALTGTVGLVGTGAILHRMGIISGRGDDDWDINETKERMGLGQYRLNISALKRFVFSGFNPESAKADTGDKIVNYDWFQPNSVMLAMGADIDANKGTNSGLIGKAAAALSESANTLTEQPLVTGLNKLFKYGDIPAGVSEVVAGMPASMIPTFLNQIKQLTDNTRRNADDPNIAKKAVNLVKNKIPGLAQSLPAQVDTKGEDKEMYQGGGNNLFNVLFNPAFESNLKDDPVGQEVLRIYRDTGESSQAPRSIGKTIQINNQSVKLTAKERQEMQRYTGKLTEAMFKKILQNKGFEELPDAEKVKVMSNIISDIHTAAKIQLLGHRPKNVSKGVLQIMASQKGKYETLRQPADLPLVNTKTASDLESDIPLVTQ